MINIVLGLVWIFISYTIYNTGIYYGHYGYAIKLGIFRLPIAILFFILGLYFIIKNKNNIFTTKERYSICPKCKETYTYNNSKDGMCPKCDVKTTDLEEYYKKK